MKLSACEKETILNYNEEDGMAEIYTFNGKLKRRLNKAAERNPEIYQLKKSDPCGSVSYIFPKKWLTNLFRAPFSEEERQRRSKRGQAIDMSVLLKKRNQSG